MKKQHKLINVELSELANGAIQEKLDHALKDVMTNILDPNTEAKKKRKITITLTMEPGENRDTLTLDAQVKATLVPEDSATTTVLVGRMMPATSKPTNFAAEQRGRPTSTRTMASSKMIRVKTSPRLRNGMRKIKRILRLLIFKDNERRVINHDGTRSIGVFTGTSQ